VTAAARAREWPPTRGRLSLVLCLLVLGAPVFLDAFEKSASATEDRVRLSIAVLYTLCIAAIVPRLVWRALQARGQPGARLEATRLLVWPAGKGDPVAVELADVTGIDWTYQNTVALRLRSGETRSVQLQLSSRSREELLAALRQALAERAPAR